MKYPYQVIGTYGTPPTSTVVLCYPLLSSRTTWYCVKGSMNVNRTHQDIENGVDVETIADFDTFTWNEPINTVEELAAAIAT